MNGKKKLVYSLLTCFFLLIVTAIFNYVVDISGVYKRDNSLLDNFVKEYVQKLVKSSYGLVQIPSERLVKAELARVSNSTCYVFGSSRMMEVNKETFPLLNRGCDSLTNLAVSGAGIQDIEALLYLVFRKTNIKHIFIGISPWSLRNDERQMWREYENDYYKAREYFFNEKLVNESDASLAFQNFIRKSENLINGEYLYKNIEYVVRNYLLGEEMIKVVSEGKINLNSFEAVTSFDGSHIYSKDYLRGRPLPDSEIGSGGYKIGAPFVAESAARELSILTNLMVERGVTVNFVLIPYHPAVWTSTSYLSLGARNAMQDVSMFISEFSEENGTTVIGGYSPSEFGLGRGNFYDAIHLNRESLKYLTRDMTPKK